MGGGDWPCGDPKPKLKPQPHPQPKPYPSNGSLRPAKPPLTLLVVPLFAYNPPPPIPAVPGYHRSASSALSPTRRC